MENFDASNFDFNHQLFSAEQLRCPVVIEIFCGSARVTASLKLLGLDACFGVDHKVKKATATAKELDLTVKQHQDILFLWLKSPLVVGVFIAPPCGTCSLARNIQLRNSAGRPIPGPRPLRSELYPEGLPNLTASENARVSAANKLYELVAKVVLFAHQHSLLVVVENPRSSLFWRTKFWKSVRKYMKYTAHQACAYGGCRPKWTVLAWNHSDFASICKTCPGESPHHSHKPWGLVTSAEGTRFSTSEETAYPKPLASAIARVFASILTKHGWTPPAEFLDEAAESSLKFMRAVATVQPKAAKIPPVVREHKAVIILKGPVRVLQKTPVQTMERLKQPWEVPSSCSSSLSTLPAGAQLLRTTPLRSKGGLLHMSEDKMEDPNQISEQAWGIPFSPGEFMSEAVKRGHPKSFSRLVPKILMEAVSKNFGQDSEQAKLASDRSKWFARWMRRALELAEAEGELKKGLSDHVRRILAPKRTILWREILEELQYPDMGVVDELLGGTSLVGKVQDCGIFEKKFKHADMTVEQLEALSQGEKRKHFHSCSSSGDEEVDRQVYQKTLEEVNLGWASGPFAFEDLPENAVLSRRFGLKQPNKIHIVDDLTGSRINNTV